MQGQTDEKIIRNRLLLDNQKLHKRLTQKYSEISLCPETSSSEASELQSSFESELALFNLFIQKQHFTLKYNSVQVEEIANESSKLNSAIESTLIEIESTKLALAETVKQDKYKQEYDEIAARILNIIDRKTCLDSCSVLESEIAGLENEILQCDQELSCRKNLTYDFVGALYNAKKWCENSSNDNEISGSGKKRKTDDEEEGAVVDD